MAKDRTTLEVTGFSITAGMATVSFGSITVEDKRPPKPPWYKRWKDRGNKAFSLAENADKIARLVERIWEYVEPFFERRQSTQT